MHTILSESEDHARAVIEGILDVDEDLIYLATDMHIYEVTEDYPIRTDFEGYVTSITVPTGVSLWSNITRGAIPTWWRTGSWTS